MLQKNLLTSFEGRIPRGQYWLGILIILASTVGLNLLIEASGGSFEKISGLVWLLYLFPYCAILTKRAHDRNRSAWFGLFGIYGIFVGSIGVIMAAYIGVPMKILEGLGSLYMLLYLVGIVWVGIELGFVKGTEGENRYGENPLP